MILKKKLLKKKIQNLYRKLSIFKNISREEGFVHSAMVIFPYAFFASVKYIHLICHLLLILVKVDISGSVTLCESQPDLNLHRLLQQNTFERLLQPEDFVQLKQQVHDSMLSKLYSGYDHALDKMSKDLTDQKNVLVSSIENTAEDSATKNAKIEEINKKINTRWREELTKINNDLDHEVNLINEGVWNAQNISELEDFVDAENSSVGPLCPPIR